MKLKSGFVFILILLISLFLIDRVKACSCAERPFEDKYKEAHSVFQGTVTSIDSQGRIYFDIEKVWKNRMKDNYVHNFEGCYFHFNVGETYLVFTYFHDGIENTNMCTGNMPINESYHDLSILDTLQRKEKLQKFMVSIIIIGLTTLILHIRFFNDGNDI